MDNFYRNYNGFYYISDNHNAETVLTVTLVCQQPAESHVDGWRMKRSSGLMPIKKVCELLQRSNAMVWMKEKGIFDFGLIFFLFYDKKL